MLAYELALTYFNRVMSKCSTLQWADISAMRNENPSIEAMANAVTWCADAVEMAADKGLLPRPMMLTEAREIEWKLREMARAIEKDDRSMLEDMLRSEAFDRQGET